MKTCNACGEAKSPTDSEIDKEKNCLKCERIKSTSEFYRGKTHGSTRSRCKDCTNIERTARYARDPAKENASNSKWYSNNSERRLAVGRKWDAKNKDAKRAIGARASAVQRLTNHEKTSARVAVREAIRTGKITRGLCEVCGTDICVEGHHPDYSKPLDVRWLCTQHHAEYHVLEREQARLARRAAKPTKEPPC